MTPVELADTFAAAIKLKELVWENKVEIIECALAIESNLVDLIANYFVQQSDREEFIGAVLNSDWCTFNAKRKLTLHVIRERELCDQKETKKIDSTLHQVMLYRNAFTHGHFTFVGNSCSLSFFDKDKLTTQPLSDEYLRTVEKLLREAYEKTGALLTKRSSAASLYKQALKRHRRR